MFELSQFLWLNEMSFNLIRLCFLDLNQIEFIMMFDSSSHTNQMENKLIEALLLFDYLSHILYVTCRLCHVLNKAIQSAVHRLKKVLTGQLN